MKPMCRHAVAGSCAVLLLATTIAVSPAPAQSDAEEWSLSESVQQAVLPHVVARRPERVLTRYVAVQEIEAVGNLGAITRADETSSFAQLENGLFGVVTSVGLRSSGSRGSARVLMLCGFIPLLIESSSTSYASVTSAVLVDKLFLPFGVRSSVDFTGRQRAVAFEASEPSLCDPAPGSEFRYRLATEATVKRTGLFGGTSNVSSAGRTTCRVGAEPQAAAEIHPALTGDYLAVACEREGDDGKRTSAEFAFLRAHGIYLARVQKQEWQTTTHRYSDVTLAP